MSASESVHTKFEQLLGQHHGIVRKVAFSYANNESDRRDLMQEILLQLWKAFPRYSPNRRFSTWMYRIALKVAISWLRRYTRPARRSVQFDEFKHDLPHEQSGSPEMEERIAMLRELISKCQPLDRALLLLYLDECSYREIAAVLGLSETNVATKLGRLKEHLRHGLTTNAQRPISMSTTTLDELKNAWKELSDKLDRQNTLALRQFKQSKLARFHVGLLPLAFGQTLQLLAGVLITGVSGQFSVNHVGTPHLMICGMLLQLYGIMFIAFAVRDLVLIRQIEYDAPVITIQKQLAKLRTWHVRTAIWFAITGSLMWLAAMIIVLYLIGGDLWVHSPRKVYWLVSSALVCVAFSYGLIKLARSPGKYGRALKNSWIGRSVNRAQAALDEIEEFEREII